MALFTRTGRRKPVSPPPRAGLVGQVAADISGVSPQGDARHLDIRVPSGILLAFLTGSCFACRTFWTAWSADSASPSLPGAGEITIVTPSPSMESRRKIAGMAPLVVPVIMSTNAWTRYRVTGAPWFIVIQAGLISAEGPAATWAELTRVVASAL